MAINREAERGPSGANFIRGSRLRSCNPSPVRTRLKLIHPGDAQVSEVDQAKISELSRGIISTYSRLDAKVLSEMKGSLVVDAYAVGPEDLALITPMEREEALENLKNYLTEIESLTLESLPREWTLIYGNVLATLVYFDELKRQKRGEPKRDYKEYLPLASGFNPVLLPPQELKETRLSIIDKLKEVGLKFKSDSINSVLAAYFAYTDSVRRYKSPQEVEHAFSHHYSKFKQPYSSALVEDLSDVDFRIIWAKAYKFWMMWERIGIAENILYANWHRRNRKNWNEGRIEMYAYHEPAHFIYLNQLKDEIRNGNLDRAAGIIPIPSPACFQLEGIAQTVPEFTAIQLSLDGKIAKEVYRLEKMAIANALYMLENDPGMTVEKAEREIRKFMLFSTPFQTRITLREGLNKPFERAYLPVYGVSDYFFRQFAKKANFEQKLAFFKLVHEQPMTPAGILQLSDEMLQAA